MIDEPSNPHPSLEALVDYVALELTPHEELQVDEHLSDCDLCLTATRDVQILSALWESWTAREHGQALMAVSVSRALSAAQVSVANQAWQVRLASWAQNWAGRAEAAVRVVMDAPGQATRVVTENLDGLLRPGSAWRFAPAPMALPTRGLAQSAAPPPEASIVVGGDGQVRARIAVSRDRHEVVVRLDDLPPGRRIPLVLLVPLTDTGEPQIGTPEQQPRTPYAIVRFGNVAAGEYLVVLEPAEPTAP